MKALKMGIVCSLAAVLLTAVCLTAGNLVAAQSEDKRKLTTVQTAAVDVAKTAKAVEIRYLNLPWGEKTFGFIENGGNQYYSTRTWPFAHLKLATNAKFNGTALKPGDYALIITPKGAEKNQSMSLSVAAYKPEGESGTFLVPGNVFTDTPPGKELTKKAISFGSGAPLSDVLKIELENEKDSAVNIKVHYGTRTLTEKLMLK
ncbi:MAG: hypothetical protein K1Y36_16855 [Blastocatellia bacterium]|nr:hypothetical protein [Blastocatellia bacterium]